MSLNLYKDKSQLFECKLKTDGNSSTLKPRMFLRFDSSKLVYMIEGQMFDDNICKINIPALNFIEDAHGYATLEAVVENTVFVPWKDEINIKKSIEFESVQIKKSNSVDKAKNEVIFERIDNIVDDKKVLKETIEMYSKFTNREKIALIKSINKRNIDYTLFENSKYYKLLKKNDIILSKLYAYNINKNN